MRLLHRPRHRALYSYLRLDGTSGEVLEVQEKKAISDLANIGAYGFPSAAVLREHILPVIDQPDGKRNQYFLSNVINKMIEGGAASFVASLAEDCAQCGTPEKLEQFLEQVSAGKALTLPKRRFCFALDNVLVTPPQRLGDLSSVQPIEKNVQLVRDLHESGHHIIITTSRMMQEKGGNIGAVVAACGPETMRMLEQFNIPYDEIHFGKPFAHVYVDANVAASALNTEKDLGWRVKGARDTLAPGMVAARHFNNVQIEGECVVKTASHSVLRGEIFFYEHMPPDIAHLFPTLISSFADGAVREGVSPKAGDEALPSLGGAGGGAHAPTEDAVAAAAAAAAAAVQTPPPRQGAAAANGHGSKAAHLFGTDTALSHPALKSGGVPRARRSISPAVPTPPTPTAAPSAGAASVSNSRSCS